MYIFLLTGNCKIKTIEHPQHFTPAAINVPRPPLQFTEEEGEKDRVKHDLLLQLGKSLYTT